MSLSLSFSRKRKHFGFTLIELMVVMAIIAILATAGLSAYTGYIKKARDATRIADVAAINTAIQGSLSANGSPPANYGAAVSAANNGQSLVDPLSGKSVCLTTKTNSTLGACGYTYSLCDGGAGYLVTAHFESTSNQEQYTTTGGAPVWYHLGSCTAWATGTTILVNNKQWMTSDLWGFYQWNRTISGWSRNTWDGTGPESGDPCPKGFHTPSSGDFSLLTLADIATLGLSKAGYLLYSSGSLYDSGTYGNYWSSSPSDTSDAFYLFFDSTFVDPAYSNYRAYGFSVRCLQD